MPPTGVETEVLLAQQEGNRQRHQKRCHQRIEAHRDTGEHARDRIDLKRAGRADAVRGDADRKTAGTKIGDASCSGPRASTAKRSRASSNNKSSIKPSTGPGIGRPSPRTKASPAN